MTLFLFGSLMIAIGVVSGVYLGNYMVERETRKERVAKTAQPAKGTSPQATAKRRLWIFPAKQPDQALQFQTWASANLQNADLRTWIAGLSKEQIHALADQLTAFCGSLGFNLDWLTGERLVGSPKLEPMAAMIIEHYCTACFQATTIQSDFQQFKQALDLVDQPFSREHKPITLKVYAELVGRSVVPPMSPDLMVAGEPERQAQIAKVLKEVATSKWTTFMAAFAAATKVDAPAKPKTSWIGNLRRPFRPRDTPAATEAAPVAATPSDSAA